MIDLKHTRDGYPLIRARDLYRECLGVESSWSRVPAHVLVAELCLLGCQLPSAYRVHHIDRDRNNFALDNLSVLTLRQHQIHHDMGCYYSRAELAKMSEANVQRIRSGRPLTVRKPIPWTVLRAQIGV